ncbi:MAG: LysR family transcriptional regulator [Janthinobacterium lividum]
MNRELFDGIVPFLAVAERLSFTRAAADLRITPTAVSRAVRQLERRHGVVLLQRTTRSVALTEAGAALFQRLRAASREIGDALDVLDKYQDRASGTLRLTLSRTAMTMVVEPLLPILRAAYPDLSLDLSVNEGTVDLAAGNFDAGIRLGESVQKDMVAVRLSPELRWSVVGSPAYLARAGRPRRPEDLTAHEAIQYRFVTSGSLHRWTFQRGQRTFSVEMPGRLIVNDRAALVACAQRGLGLAYVSEMEAREPVAAGHLETLLTKFIKPDTGMFLYFPTRMQTQPKLRAFIDVARAALAQQESSDLREQPRRRRP